MLISTSLAIQAGTRLRSYCQREQATIVPTVFSRFQPFNRWRSNRVVKFLSTRLWLEAIAVGSVAFSADQQRTGMRDC
jgi:hypothetical protein